MSVVRGATGQSGCGRHRAAGRSRHAARHRPTLTCAVAHDPARRQYGPMPFEITEQIQRHLDDDRTVLLTTVTPTNRPAPRPVWFLWDGTKFVVFSRPNTAKLRHIAVNPNVTLGNGIGARGADTIVISGTAQIVPDAPS